MIANTSVVMIAPRIEWWVTASETNPATAMTKAGTMYPRGRGASPSVRWMIAPRAGSSCPRSTRKTRMTMSGTRSVSPDWGAQLLPCR